MSLLFLFFLSFLSEGHVVITSGSFQGLAQADGEVVIPPVYDAVGWSDGSIKIHKESIGFKENEKWGLISLKNKRLSDPSFVILRPFEEDLILAAVKGEFSNLPFYGLLDSKGKTIVRFSYFQLSRLSDDLILSSTYENGEVRYGILSFDGAEVIPPVFEKIEILAGRLAAYNFGKVKLFSKQGVPLIDSYVEDIRVADAGFIIENEGKFGWINQEGKMIHPAQFKLVRDEATYDFNTWEVKHIFDDTLSWSIQADSIDINSQQQFIAHVNNVQHFLGGEKAQTLSNDYALKFIDKGFMIIQSHSTGLYSLIKTDGEEIAKDYDFIRSDGTYFFCKKDKAWSIRNTFGENIAPNRYTKVGDSHNLMVPVMDNGYWGWLDFDGLDKINLKYDQVLPGAEPTQFIGQYVNSWGVFNFEDGVIIMPQYDSIYKANGLYIAAKNSATTILNQQGQILLNTGMDVYYRDDIIQIVDFDGQLGTITSAGVQIASEYSKMEVVGGDYIVMQKDGYVEVFDQLGNKTVSVEDEISEVISLSDGYFRVFKDGKYGFIDLLGNLRIANRYEGALDFSHGLSGIKIGNKWGFIDKSEGLVVQPLYESVTSFQSDLAVAKDRGKYGIINRKGETIVSFQWDSIKLFDTGNYLLRNEQGAGMANAKGQIILRPNYEDLIDTHAQLVIATKNGKKGVLDYQGFTKTPFEYEEIEIVQDYLLLLKQKEYVPNRP